MVRRALLLSLAVMGACTTPPTPTGAPFAGNASRVHPAVAAGQDRIQFIGEYHALSEMGYKAGFAARFKKFLGGGRDDRLIRPYAIDEHDDWLAIADPGAGHVISIDRKRRRYNLIGASDSLVLSSPVGVALGDDVLYVADSALGKVFKFDDESNLVQTLDQFSRPTSLAYDHSNRRLYVVDTANHEISVVDERGNTARQFGSRGSGENEFNFPTHIELMGDRLLVVDALNFRVQTFSFDGRVLGSFGIHGDQPGQFAQPKGIAAHRDGHIYVAESVSGLVQVFDLNGGFLTSFGSKGEGPGSFLLPAGIHIEQDLIYVADSGNGRIQLFRYLGAGK